MLSIIYRPGLLHIQNPDAPDQDIGKNSYLLPKIRRAFEQTYQLLLIGNGDGRTQESMLRLVIRGDDPNLVMRANKLRGFTK